MKELNIRISHLQKAYTRPVLTDVNLEVTNDSYVTILGKSGSGKSTLLNILGLVEGYDGASTILMAPGSEITPTIPACGWKTSDLSSSPTT